MIIVDMIIVDIKKKNRVAEGVSGQETPEKKAFPEGKTLKTLKRGGEEDLPGAVPHRPERIFREKKEIDRARDFFVRRLSWMNRGGEEDLPGCHFSSGGIGARRPVSVLPRGNLVRNLNFSIFSGVLKKNVWRSEGGRGVSLGAWELGG